MSRIKQGWQLTKKSWGLLRSNKQLFRFPIYGALAALVVMVVAVLPGLYLIEDGQQAVGGVLTAVGLYLSSFVAIYFGVALAATADLIFHGRDATTADGFAVARERIGAIAGWAALSALVGVIVAALQRGGSIGEAIAGTIIGTAWSLITFLSVPVIAIEGTGPVETLKRSASLFKSRWAGQVTGNVAIGGIVLLAGVLPAVLVIAAGVYLWMGDDGGAGLAGGAVLVGIGAIVLVISMLLVRALQGVFGVALYRFAAEGETAAGFTQAELESAVRTR